MVQYINLKTIEKEAINSIFKKLKPLSGTCIFIDIVNSTSVKYNHGVKEWIQLIKNTFSLISVLNGFHDHIIKFIGDEIMIFIRDDDFGNSLPEIKDPYNLLEELYSTLYILREFPVEGTYLSCKIGIHRCEDVYNITFFEGYNDYYGKDIDLTARLMEKVGENQIVMTEKFYQHVLKLSKIKKIELKSSCLSQISEKFEEGFRGVPEVTYYRQLDSKEP